jgi:hypothetical protein
VGFGVSRRRIYFVYSQLVAVPGAEGFHCEGRRIGGFQAVVVVFSQGQGLIRGPVFDFW